MNKHAPTPWQITTYSNYEGFSIHSVHDPKFGCIAERWEKNVKEDRNRTIHANAHFIVEAVNNYDRIANLEKVNAALVAKLEEVICIFNATRTIMTDRVARGLTLTIVKEAQEVIALAKQSDIDPVTKLPFNRDTGE